MSVITKILFDTAGRIKPLLMKIVPLPVLWKIRNVITARSFRKILANVHPYEAGHYKKGVNLIGNIRSDAGLGQSCRLVASALEQTGIPLNIYQYTPSGQANHADTAWDAKLSKELAYEINLIHINPLELGTAYCRIDPHAWDYRYNIAFWLWELEEFPDEWTMYFQGLDEIWAPSAFTCEAIRKKTSLPVTCMPYYVEAPVHESYTRAHFHLPEERFLFLMMYDSRSCAERKNPEAVMHAFQKAFAPSDQSVGLVIKINHAAKEDERHIQNIMNGYTNIYLIKELLDRNGVNNLIQCADVVVSLHRAEGFGLVLAEAMLLGTPVIATNWSANTEFMNEEIACMTDYEFVTLEKELPPFHAGCRWADPDVAQAAEYMKKLHEDRAFAKELAQRAKKYMEDKLSMQQAAARIRDRLEQIDRELKKYEKNRSH